MALTTSRPIPYSEMGLAKLLSHNDIRQALADSIGRPDLPEPLWKLLNQRGRPDDLLAGSITLAMIEEEVREFMDFHREMLMMRGTSARNAVPTRPMRRDLARAEALSTYLAALAVQSSYFPLIPPDPDTGEDEIGLPSDTVSFRQEELGGQVLSPEAALGLAASRVAAHWSYRDFIDRGVPLESHRSKVIYSFPRAPGQFGLPYRSIDVIVEWPDSQLKESFDRPMPLGDPTEGFLTVTIESRSGLNLEREADQHSTLGKACKLAKDLSRHYPWRPGQSVWFLLTGEPPFVAPLRTWSRKVNGFLYNHARLVIEVEPWVGVRSLIRSFLRAKRETLVGINRAPSVRRSQLLAFMAQFEEPRGQPIDWEARRRGWNKTHPKLMYSSIRNFRRALEAAERSIVWPTLQEPTAPSRRRRNIRRK